MNIADALSQHASARPYAVAIVEDNQPLHFKTLDALIWAAAAYLRRAGIAPGDIVGMTYAHSALHLVALCALGRIGAVTLALSVSDSRALRTAYAQRFGVQWVVSSDPVASLDNLPIVVMGAADLRQRPAESIDGLRFDGGDHPWFIRRTSGTTSEAKGVIFTHNDHLREMRSRAAFYAGPDDRYLAIIDMNMTFGSAEALRTLQCGGTVVIPKTPMQARDMFEAIDRYAITRLAMTPNYLEALVPLLPQDGVRCPTLRDVTVAGMAIPESSRREVRRRMTPNLRIRYGTNETGAITVADGAMQEKFPETVGAVQPDLELEIVDDHDRPLPRGEIGRIRVRTPWMPSGYLNLPEAANKVFRHGWAYTGDMGVLSPEGMLFLKGRVDDMMNFDGIKIMPTDIEEALLQHPAVVEAAAFPASSQRHQNIPMAAVTVRAAVTPEALLDHCSKLLGLRAPVLVAIEPSLPKNEMGKIVKRELAARLANELPAILR